MAGRTICYFLGFIVSPIPRIPPGILPQLRQALACITRILDDIVAVRGRYEPGPRAARLGFALALSLAMHAFVLSLRFGVGGVGLPGLALPWTERRAFSSDLRVRLAQAPRAQPAPAAPGNPAVPRRPAAAEPMTVRPLAAPTAVARPPAVRSAARQTLVARAPAKPAPAKRRPSRAKAPVALPAVPAASPAPAETPARDSTRQPRAQPELVAQAEPQRETFSVPPPMQGVPETAPADGEAARRAAEQAAARLEQMRQQEESRRQEEARAEALEREARARTEEAARQQAAAVERQRELERQEEARKQQEAAREQAAALERQWALELEAKRQQEENAMRLALELEMLRQAEEAARQAAALAREREEQARRQAEERAARERAAQELEERLRAEALAESQRQREAERLAAEGAAARAAQASAEPGRSASGTIGPGNISGRDLAARALEQLRTPGALRAEPPPERPFAQLPLTPPSSAGAENPRRGQAGADRDIGLRMYVEGWRWKIERNGNLNYPSGARTRAADHPVVTVAIRADGSVEKILIHRSSGQRDLDEAVRRIVRLYAPYSAFPPDLARAYDVIEIRRVWVFANTLRILEELN